VVVDAVEVEAEANAIEVMIAKVDENVEEVEIESAEIGSAVLTEILVVQGPVEKDQEEKKVETGCQEKAVVDVVAKKERNDSHVAEDDSEVAAEENLKGTAIAEAATEKAGNDQIREFDCDTHHLVHVKQWETFLLSPQLDLNAAIALILFKMNNLVSDLIATVILKLQLTIYNNYLDNLLSKKNEIEQSSHQLRIKNCGDGKCLSWIRQEM